MASGIVANDKYTVYRVTSLELQKEKAEKVILYTCPAGKTFSGTVRLWYSGANGSIISDIMSTPSWQLLSSGDHTEFNVVLGSGQTVDVVAIAGMVKNTASEVTISWHIMGYED